MFEGLIQLQLPFILISSGISSGLYLLFLFFNIGQATEQPQSKIHNEAFTIEIASETQDQQAQNTLYDYLSYTYISVTSNQVIPKPHLKEIRPIKCRSFWRAYSFQFAQASYSRPPPVC